MNLQQMILFVDDDCCRPGMSVHGSTDAGIQEYKPLVQHPHRITPFSLWMVLFYWIKLFFLKLGWVCFLDLHPSSATMITWNGVIYISSLDNSACM
jgi:hypothetical protein